MRGADPIADLLYYLEFAGLIAFVSLWQTWTWLTLLTCIPLGGTLRSYYERRSAMLLGGIVVMVVLTLNTALIGLNLADDPDMFRGIWPDYFFPLVVMFCWLLHLPVGLLALGVGVGASEVLGVGAWAGDVWRRRSAPQTARGVTGAVLPDRGGSLDRLRRREPGDGVERRRAQLRYCWPSRPITRRLKSSLCVGRSTCRRADSDVVTRVTVRPGHGAPHYGRGTGHASHVGVRADRPRRPWWTRGGSPEAGHPSPNRWA